MKKLFNANKENFDANAYWNELSKKSLRKNTSSKKPDMQMRDTSLPKKEISKTPLKDISVEDLLVYIKELEERVACIESYITSEDPFALGGCHS